MPKYTYDGNRDGNNKATAIFYAGQGTVYDEGSPPEIRVGDEIELTAAERDRLAPYFILKNKTGDDVGEGAVAPTTTGVGASGDDKSTSGDVGTIRGTRSSASSDKS